MGKRLSITLTDAQERALDELAEVSGASLQSMVGLAVTAWLRGQQPQEPQANGPELVMRMFRDGRQVQQVRARWADHDRGVIVATARRHATGEPWREYDGPQTMTLQDGITVDSFDPWDTVDDTLYRDEREEREERESDAREHDASPIRKGSPYELRDLLRFLGTSAPDYYVEGIERDATERDPETGRAVWAVDRDALFGVCADNDLMSGYEYPEYRYPTPDEIESYKAQRRRQLAARD